MTQANQIATSMDRIRLWECRGGQPYILRAFFCPKCHEETTDTDPETYWQIKKHGKCFDCVIREDIRVFEVVAS